MRPRLFYGWILVAVAFVTMAIGVNARTAFSLFFPPILAEFGWERGRTAGAFAFGFIFANLFTPFLGRAMDRWGPRVVLPAGWRWCAPASAWPPSRGSSGTST